MKDDKSAMMELVKMSCNYKPIYKCIYFSPPTPKSNISGSNTPLWDPHICERQYQRIKN
jgi:hypothetical protein